MPSITFLVTSITSTRGLNPYDNFCIRAVILSNFTVSFFPFLFITFMLMEFKLCYQYYLSRNLHREKTVAIPWWCLPRPFGNHLPAFQRSWSCPAARSFP